MQLNGAAVNARGLNAVKRVPVPFAGDSAFSVVPALSGTRYVLGRGAAKVELDSSVLLRAQRFGVGSVVVQVVPAIAQTITRCGAGTARIVISGALYYQRVVYGTGELRLVFTARGDVGVKFGSGVAVFTPLEASLSGAKAQLGSGVARIGVHGEFRASAIRRGVTKPTRSFVAVQGALEPSHITEFGVRYVGGFGEALVELSVLDEGMLRQSHVGWLEITKLSASLAGITHRPTLAGKAIHTVNLSGTFLTRRQLKESLRMAEVFAECSGEVLVRGEGSLPIVFAPRFSGSVIRQGALAPAVLGIHTEGDFVRVKAGSGTAVISIGLTGEGHRGLAMQGKLVIEALTFSSAVVNPYAEDTNEETFVRKAQPREFARKSSKRLFVR